MHDLMHWDRSSSTDDLHNVKTLGGQQISNQTPLVINIPWSLCVILIYGEEKVKSMIEAILRAISEITKLFFTLGH
jgi:hypothetical protein